MRVYQRHGEYGELPDEHRRRSHETQLGAFQIAMAVMHGDQTQAHQQESERESHAVGVVH